MAVLLLIAAILSANTPAASVTEALNEFDLGNYARAGALLDQFATDEPAEYRANNLHYLRGRIAEDLEDWPRAEREYNLVGADSVLYDLAVWHLARIALVDDRPDDARTAIEWLPRGFPADMMMELAALAPEDLALDLYDSMSTREARLESALIRRDMTEIWSLLRENQNDDVAVKAARQLYDPSLEGQDRLFLARVYASHRSFDLAEPMYASLLEDPELAPEAHYGLGRVYFQLTDYDDAIRLYRATMLLFPGSEWAEQAEAQIPTTYWRELDFESAASAYIDLLEKSEHDRQRYQDSVRDLVDIYRSMDDSVSALAWIDRGLSNRPSATEQAVLVFAKAKIEYHDGDYDAALASFHQLAGMNLRDVPNGTDLEEVRFLESLVLEKLGRLDEAQGIWLRLAEMPFSYYGMQAAARLQAADSTPAGQVGVADPTPTRASGPSCRRTGLGEISARVRSRRLSETREWTSGTGETTRTGELVFLHLWDEAFYWTNREASRYSAETLADLAFLAGQYRQAILYADRLRPRRLDALFASDASRDPDVEVLLAMLFPDGYANFLCGASAGSKSDPLWLRSIIWQESRYDPLARSGAVARGLMQFIPETALDVGLASGMPDLEVTRSLYLPGVSIRLGARYWASLISEFGLPEMALAAYNGGPHNVRRWQAKSMSDEPELFVADIGFVQTKDYVRRIFELYARYAYVER